MLLINRIRDDIAGIVRTGLPESNGYSADAHTPKVAISYLEARNTTGASVVLMCDRDELFASATKLVELGKLQIAHLFGSRGFIHKLHLMSAGSGDI